MLSLSLNYHLLPLYFFFFKHKTSYELRISDWSSDVCSSDLGTPAPVRVHFRACMPPRRLCIVAAGQPCPVAEICMGADPSLTCGPVAWEIDDEQDVGSEGGGRDAAGGGRRGRRGS